MLTVGAPFGTLYRIIGIAGDRVEKASKDRYRPQIAAASRATRDTASGVSMRKEPGRVRAGPGFGIFSSDAAETQKTAPSAPAAMPAR